MTERTEAKRQIAAQMFDAWHTSMIAHQFHGKPHNDADFNYKHGWIEVNGESYNHDLAFPQMRFPRFPADQGCND